MTEIHSAKLPNIIRTAIKKLKRAGVDMIATFHRDTCSVGRIFFTSVETLFRNKCVIFVRCLISRH